jgi:hypothetical protein
MGRTLTSITQTFLQEQESYAPFRRALDDLFAAAHQHLATAAYAAAALPFETFLLAMLLEEHKRVVLMNEKISSIELIQFAKE